MCQKRRCYYPGENRTPNGHFHISDTVPSLQELASYVIMRTNGYYDYRSSKPKINGEEKENFLDRENLDRELEIMKMRIQHLPRPLFRKLPLYIFENSEEIMNRPFYMSHVTIEVPLHVYEYMKNIHLPDKFFKCSGYFFVHDPNLPSGYHLVNFTYQNQWSGTHSWNVEGVIDLFSDSVLSHFTILMSLIRIFLCIRGKIVLPWCFEKSTLSIDIEFSKYIKNYIGTFPVQYPDVDRILFYAHDCSCNSFYYIHTTCDFDFCLLHFDKYLKEMSPPGHDLEYILTFLIRQLFRFRMNGILNLDNIKYFLELPHPPRPLPALMPSRNLKMRKMLHLA